MIIKTNVEKFDNVSILLPTLNETFSFVQTIQTILDTCDSKYIKEFIVIICDRTTKESRESIKQGQKIAEEHKIPFIVFNQTLPFAGGAVRDGINKATGSHILMMAPDLETDPVYVCDFIKEAQKYPKDMITASRWLKKGAFKGYNPVKLVLNFMFQKIFTILYNVKLTDITFGYRLAPTDVLQAINWEEVKHPFFLETLLKPLKLGVKVHEIPTTWKSRCEGESQNSFWATFKYLRIAFKVKFEGKKSLVK